MPGRATTRMSSRGQVVIPEAIRRRLGLREGMEFVVVGEGVVVVMRTVRTNVLMSAVFFGGAPLEILRAWRKCRVKLVASAAILEEYSRVVDELVRRYPLEAGRSVVALVSERAEIVEGGDIGDLRGDDPDDVKFFACAAAGIPVMTPRAMVGRLASRRPKTLRPE